MCDMHTKFQTLVRQACVTNTWNISGQLRLVPSCFQILQHPAAVSTGLWWADGGDGESWPGRQVGPRHGDLPTADPKQALPWQRIGRCLQQPLQLEKRTRFQHPAGLQGSRPHPPVCQKKVLGQCWGRPHRWKLITLYCLHNYGYHMHEKQQSRIYYKYLLVIVLGF